MTKQKQILFKLLSKLHQTVKSQRVEHSEWQLTELTKKVVFLPNFTAFTQIIFFIMFYLKISENMNKIKNNLKYKKKYQVESTNQIVCLSSMKFVYSISCLLFCYWLLERLCRFDNFYLIKLLFFSLKCFYLKNI